MSKLYLANQYDKRDDLLYGERAEGSKGEVGVGV